jgi:hypothetical protein
MKNKEAHAEILKEIEPYEDEFCDWLDENRDKIDRIDLYNKISLYPVSERAKMHLAHSAGRAMYIHGYR